MGREMARWGEKRHMCKHIFTDTGAVRVYDTHEDVWMWLRTRYVQKNVRATGECVCSHPVVDTVVATTCVRNPFKKTLSWKILAREKMNIHHSMTILTKKILQFVIWVRWVQEQNPFKILRLHRSMSVLIFLAGTCSHQLAFHQLSRVGASRFPEACVSGRPTFLISWFSMMPLCGLFPIVQDQWMPFELLEDHHDI